MEIEKGGDRVGKFREVSMNLRLATILMWMTLLPMSLGAADPAPIAVRLLVSIPRVCARQKTIDLEAVLTTNSSKIVEMSSDGVSYIVDVTKIKDGKSIDERNFLREITPTNWVRIASHQSVIIPFTESISSDAPFVGPLFTEPGTFAMFIDFAIIQKNSSRDSRLPNSVRSNTAMFMTSDCDDANRLIR